MRRSSRERSPTPRPIILHPPVAPTGHAELDLTFERRVWAIDASALVCGVDEAGRGPLAGPVVAAACIVLPPALWGGDASSQPIGGVCDSKEMSEESREELFPKLLQSGALVFGCSCIDHAAIDRVNILNASMLAMERAVCAAREALVARLGGSALKPVAGLPADDALYGPSGPTPLKISVAAAKGLLRKNLHTVFIDGPKAR